MSDSTINPGNDLLKGVRVLDLSQYIPGPYASLQMLRMGAQVIKVEPPGGDPMRYFGWEGQQPSPVYQHLNNGKRIVELDLKNTTGKQKLKQIVQSANVLLEGFRPGTLDRLGFSYAVLSKLNPSLIVCRISGFGQTGKRAQRAGHDLGYGAYAGLYASVDSDQNPQIVFPPVVDHAGALKALGMISAALYQQVTTNKGCELDISLSQSVADWQYFSDSGSILYLISGGAACYHFYRSKDHHHLTLAALEPKFWHAFCEAVGRADWIPRHKEMLPQTSLIAELEVLFESRSRSQWQALLGEIDCCFESVAEFAEFNQNTKRMGRLEKNSGQAWRNLPSVETEKINWSN